MCIRDSLRGASTTFCSNSHINLGNFKVLIPGDYGGALQYISLKVIPKPGVINYSSALTATVMSGELMGTGTALVAEAVQQDVTEDATAQTTVGADVWHRRLGHPAEQVMRRLQNTSETDVKFEGSLSPCETCKINKSVQQDHPKTVESVISERLHLVSTDLTGPITPPAQGGLSFYSQIFRPLHKVQGSLFHQNEG